MLNKPALKRIALSLAAATLLTALAACSEPVEDTSGKEDVTTAADTTAAETELDCDLPDDLDYDGATVRFLNYTYFQADYYTLNADEQTGDVVNDAVYSRNQAVMDRLNVSFEFTDEYAMGGKDFATLVKAFVTANDDAYDIIHGVQYQVAQNVVNNYFLNLNGLPYIDVDQPWWATDYIKEATVGNDKYYMLTGDITLGHIRHMSCIYFNKEVYENYYGDPNDFYQLVYNGDWTLDKFSEMVSSCYQDINGDGKADNDDAYGVGVHVSNLTDHFTYDAGIRCTTRDEDGIPQLTMNNETTINFTQKLYSIYYENVGVHVYPATDDTSYVTLVNKISNNEVLLLLGWLHSSDYLRDMTVDYGVIPFPKYSETQETYYSLPHDISNVYVLPITCSTDEMSAAVLEAMAFEGYKTVIPAYYEVALKTKYFRDSDEISNQIVDMIHDNPTTDFAYIYNYALGGIGLVMRELMSSKSSDFASKYAKIEAGVQKKLDTLIELYTEIGD